MHRKNKTLFMRKIEAIAQEKVDPIPADLNLPANPPGRLFGSARGPPMPGTAPSPRGGDSNDDIAVVHYTAKPYSDNSSSDAPGASPSATGGSGT